MPAVPSFIIGPLWAQFAALIPPVEDSHPLGCHRPRVPDRVVFDKLVQVLVLGAPYEEISDPTCAATPYTAFTPGTEVCTRIDLYPSARCARMESKSSGRSRPEACPYVRSPDRDAPPSS